MIDAAKAKKAKSKKATTLSAKAFKAILRQSIQESINELKSR